MSAIPAMITAEVAAANLARYATDIVSDIAIQRGGGISSTYMAEALAALAEAADVIVRVRGLLEAEIEAAGLDMDEAA
jgi:hypothetical protein